MRNLTKIGFALLLAVALVLPVGPVAEAQFTPAGAQSVGAAQSGVTSYNPILIKYVGSSPAGGTVTIDAGTGDITLKTGPVGSSSADVTTECPVSGDLGGVIDVSDAACNTLGEVVDAINASANWRAVIQDGRRTDSSNNTLNTLSETSASVPQGLALAGDGAVSLKSVIKLAPVRDDIRWYLNTGGDQKLNANPFDQSQTAFLYAVFDHTNGSAPFRNVYSVRSYNKAGGPAVASTAASIVGKGTETVTTLYSINSEGTTDFSHTPLVSKTAFGGESILVEGVGGASYDTLVLLSASGLFYPKATPSTVASSGTN